MKYLDSVIKIKNDINDVDVHIYHLILSDFNEIKDNIEREIVDIWEADLGYDSESVKKDIYNTMCMKDDNKRHGMCAEFFMHLFLRSLGYKQKFLFSNLEERSMKKGFDGLYEYVDEFWIAESKCGIIETKHKDKIREALNDIDNKITNSSGNNPWKNALHHIMIRNNDKNETLTKKVLKLSNDYINKIEHNSSEFNLIPTSTLFINNNQSDDEIRNEIKDIISGRKIKSMIVLCINNDVYNAFIDYLRGN